MPTARKPKLVFNSWELEGKVSSYGIIYLFTLTVNGFLAGGSGTTIRHTIQMTRHTK
jgi:hypothetical protein